jgi:uncharacterized membrane protein YfcA
MTDPVVVYVVLCLSAFAAGAVNSVAGGGTLLTFPALLAVFKKISEWAEKAGVLANATSTLALMPGSLAGSLAYRRELAECRRLVMMLIAPSMIGGAVGSLLVTEFPPLVFDTLIPWLILTASILFMIQGPIKRLTGTGRHGPPGWRTAVAVIAGQFLIAVYGGYFGAGIGILMLAVLPFMGTKSIHQTNAAKTILAGCINAVTVVVFVVKGVVVWPYALAMAAAAIVGGYVGGRVARRLPSVYVRSLVIVIGLGLGGYYLWKQFGGGS